MRQLKTKRSQGRGYNLPGKRRKGQRIAALEQVKDLFEPKIQWNFNKSNIKNWISLHFKWLQTIHGILAVTVISVLPIWHAETNIMHSNWAVMRGIVMNRIQNTDQTFEHESFGRGTRSRSQQYSASMYIVHMVVLTDLLPYNTAALMMARLMNHC